MKWQPILFLLFIFLCFSVFADVYTPVSHFNATLVFDQAPYTPISPFNATLIFNEITAAAGNISLSISSFQFKAINSSGNLIGVGKEAFNFSNLQNIEKMNMSFIINDSSGVKDNFTIFFTANGTQSCALGNRQSATCYNYTNEESTKWIIYKNNSVSTNFNDSGKREDYISCYVYGTSTIKNYECEIDEHYAPNIWKHYPFDFSQIKWQNGNNEKIKKQNVWKINLTNESIGIPSNADRYRIDFNVNYTLMNPPTSPLILLLCNSSYVTGNPQSSPDCLVVDSKNPSDLQQDGTKYISVFTNNLVSSLNHDVASAIILSNTPTSKYYEMKTYKYLGSENIKTLISTNNGGTYNALADGYETDFDFHWYYSANGTSKVTQFVAKVEGENNNGLKVNSSEQKYTWLSGTSNLVPNVVITDPLPNSSLENFNTINWTTIDSDNYVTNITLIKGNTGTVTSIRENIDKHISNITFNFSIVTIGIYNLTVESCENETAELYCSNSSEEIIVVDTNLPDFDQIPKPVSLEFFYDTLNLKINASDRYFDQFFINDTVRFNITLDGWLRNKTRPNVGDYWLNVSINDTSANTVSFTLFISVDDTISPVVTLINSSFSTIDSTPTIYFNFTEVSNPVNATLYINGSWNASSAPTDRNFSSLTTTTLNDGHYIAWVNITDNSNHIGNSSAISIILDATAPSFDQIPHNRTLEYFVDNLDIKVNSSDSDADIFFVNDTTNFNITFDGNLKNATILDTITHHILVNINDTLNNINSFVLEVNVTDTIAPRWNEIPKNTSGEYDVDSLNIDFNATEEKGLFFHVNDSSNFNITQEGILRNKTVLSIKTHLVTIYANDSSDNINSSVFQYIVSDTISPVVHLINSSFNTSSSTPRIYFNYQDHTTNANTSLYLNGSFSNSTLAPKNTTGYIAIKNVSDGHYLVQINVTDNSSNMGNSSTIIVVIDTTAPNIQFVSPTPSSGSSQIILTITANVTVSDGIGIDFINITLYNSTSLMNYSESSVGITQYNFTFGNLYVGTWYLNATSFDTLGNKNSTETRTITILSGYSNFTFNPGLFNQTKLDQNYFPNWTKAWLQVNFSDNDTMQSGNFTWNFSEGNVTTNSTGWDLNFTSDVGESVWIKLNESKPHINVWFWNESSNAILLNTTFQRVFTLSVADSKLVNITIDLINISQTYVNWSLTRDTADFSFNLSFGS